MAYNREIHAREVVYWLSGLFAGVSVKYFISKVLLHESFFSGKDDISDVAFYVMFLISCIAAPLIDDHMRQYNYYSNYSKIRKTENIIVGSINLFFAVLLVCSILYKG